MLWIFYIGLLIGLILGFAVRGFLMRRSPVGTICVYENEDGEEPYMFLVLERDIGSVLESKTVVLKIENTRK